MKRARVIVVLLAGLVVAIGVAGCARSNAAGGTGPGAAATPQYKVCAARKGFSELIIEMKQRGCSDEQATAFGSSMRQAALRAWDIIAFMERTDRQAKRYGGRVYESRLALAIDSGGAVASVSMPVPSGAEEIDRHSLERFGVGVQLAPPPDCGMVARGLEFKLDLCLEVENLPEPPR